MKIRITIAYASRYRRGHLIDFVPPLTGSHPGLEQGPLRLALGA